MRITKLHHLLGQTVVCKVYIPTLLIDYITVVISYTWVYDSAITITDTQLEGKTGDEAIKRVGLNPEHWQVNIGENMEIKEESPSDFQDFRHLIPEAWKHVKKQG